MTVIDYLLRNHDIGDVEVLFYKSFTQHSIRPLLENAHALVYVLLGFEIASSIRCRPRDHVILSIDLIRSLPSKFFLGAI